MIITCVCCLDQLVSCKYFKLRTTQTNLENSFSVPKINYIAVQLLTKGKQRDFRRRTNPWSRWPHADILELKILAKIWLLDEIPIRSLQQKPNKSRHHLVEGGTKQQLVSLEFYFTSFNFHSLKFYYLGIFWFRISIKTSIREIPIMNSTVMMKISIVICWLLRQIGFDLFSLWCESLRETTEGNLIK